VRVCVARSVGSLQILPVGVSRKGNSWMVIGVAISTSCFDLFCGKIRFLQPSERMVKDCKPVLPGGEGGPMFDRRLLDLMFVVGGYCGLQSIV
jgi:hypothetical protein